MSESSDLDAHNTLTDAEIAPVIESLRALDSCHVKAALDSKAEIDPEAGIIIAELPEVPPLEADGQVFQFFGARILPVGESTTNYVKPHVHQVGKEPYIILDGTGGEMNIGWIEDDIVDWDTPRPAMPGQAIIIEEGQVHSLRNTTDVPFDFVFACPPSHLQDGTPEASAGQQDRIFTAGLGNELPPHYSQTTTEPIA